ncbi:MAG: hypothetical protein GF411_14230 [Candidatus Lokiarchaeota archaeon]|nr:hypothetical protein [Candidatus Lokiarchaeota archaeon]
MSAGTDGYTFEFVARMGSGVRVYQDDYNYHRWKGYRFDCGCLQFECGTEGTGEVTGTEPITRDRICNIGLFQDNNQNDWNCDKVEIEGKILLEETFGAHMHQADGELANLLVADGSIPQNGSYDYVDDYGLIYHVEWESANNRIDIISEVFDPRVWGEDEQGFIENRRVYRRGIVTITRQIIMNTPYGYMVTAEGSEQYIDTRQTNYICPDTKPDDPFTKHLDSMVRDDIDNIVVTGARWGDVDESTDSDNKWSGVGGSDGGMYWTNVWA